MGYDTVANEEYKACIFVHGGFWVPDSPLRLSDVAVRET